MYGHKDKFCCTSCVKPVSEKPWFDQNKYRSSSMQSCQSFWSDLVMLWSVISLQSHESIYKVLHLWTGFDSHIKPTCWLDSRFCKCNGRTRYAGFRTLLWPSVAISDINWEYENCLQIYVLLKRRFWAEQRLRSGSSGKALKKLVFGLSCRPKGCSWLVLPQRIELQPPGTMPHNIQYLTAVQLLNGLDCYSDFVVNVLRLALAYSKSPSLKLRVSAVRMAPQKTVVLCSCRHTKYHDEDRSRSKCWFEIVTPSYAPPAPNSFDTFV